MARAETHRLGTQVRIAAALAALALLGGGATAQAKPVPRAAVPVVRAYLAALDRHDGAAVCRLFAPRLRSYEAEWDRSATGRPDCTAAVDGHFRSYDSRRRWASAVTRGRPAVQRDPRTGIVAVHLVLLERYVCARQTSPPERCRPGRYREHDIVYLLARRGRWQIVKPGAVYRASEVDSPSEVDDSFLFAPGTPATVAGTVSAPPVAASCPAGASVASPPHRLQSTFIPNPRGGPGHEGWLEITSLTAARISASTMCFTLGLAAPPRPDSEYSIGVGAPGEGATADVFDIAFDGLGEMHPMLDGIGTLGDPRLAPRLPRASLDGTSLQIIGSDPQFTLRSFLLSASGESIQDDEPLLSRPLDAGDSAPVDACLTFPSGALDRKGDCGEAAGP